MLNKLFGPQKEDICPNCGTACFATDVLCPNCGKNLDELFEQLPDLDETHNIFELTFNYFSFINWLVPLLIILSPILLCLVVGLSVRHVIRLLPQDILQLIRYVVLPSALLPTVLISISAIPLFLCTVPIKRVRLGQSFVAVLAFLFSVLASTALWIGLSVASITAGAHTFLFIGALVDFVGPPDWVYSVIGFGIALIVLNFIEVISKMISQEDNHATE